MISFCQLTHHSSCVKDVTQWLYFSCYVVVFRASAKDHLSGDVFKSMLNESSIFTETTCSTLCNVWSKQVGRKLCCHTQSFKCHMSVKAVYFFLSKIVFIFYFFIFYFHDCWNQLITQSRCLICTGDVIRVLLIPVSHFA